MLFLNYCGYFKETDDIREPIPVSDIDWKYLSKYENDVRVDTIVVYSPGHTFGIAYYQLPLFAKLMDKNTHKIYKKANNHSIKIHLVFAEAYVINSLYLIDKYNGKDSTFYVDDSLIPEIKKVYYTSVEKIDNDILYNSD